MGWVVGTGNRLSYDEWHAMVLGIVIGLVAVSLQKSGSREVAAGLVAVFVLVALGQRGRERTSAAQRTIRQKPWYALVGLVAGGGAALTIAALLI